MRSRYGFSLLASLVLREAALKDPQSSFSSGRERRGRRDTRFATLGALVLLAMMLCGAARSDEPVYDIDIPAMNAAQALNRFAEQTGAITLFSYDLANVRQANAVRGRYTLLEGLELLLRGTGLSGGLSDKRVVSISQSGNAQRPREEPPVLNEKASLRKRFTAFFTTMLAASAASGQEANVGTQALEEIIVTATKREEPVRKISGSVTAFDQAGLDAVGAESFADYLTRTPGVVFNQTVPGNSAVIVRGVATTTGIAQAQGTTGYFINDVPLTDPFYSGGIPDIDTFDVDSITILRGPQGSLFGSSSLGGAINYQAAKPDLTRFDSRVRATVESARGGNMSYSGKIMLNAPIATDVFAVRGVFDYRQDGGYIDNVGMGRSDVNETEVRGGRILATLAPAEGTTINYLFLQQTQDTDDAGYAEPAVGSFAKSTMLAEEFSYRTRIHNLRLDQEFSFATLTATAARHEKKFSGTQDYLKFLPPSFAPFAPVTFLEPGVIEGDTFEVRLASPSGQRFEYLIGVFHDSTDEEIVNQLVAPNAAAAFGDALLLDATVNVEGKERALFGEATWHFTDQLKATLGGRYFETRLTTVTDQSGPLVGAASTTRGESSENGFSPKVSLTWTPSDDFLVYGLVSKGFRFGGPNIAIDPAIRPEFESDSLINYELGARTNLLDRRLQLDGTAFYIDWSDMQVTQASPSGFTYTANAGKARNFGFEGTATFQPSRSLTLQGNVTWLDSELRTDFLSGGAIVPAGATLPGASEWQISDAAIYTFVDSGLRPSIAFSHRYISTAPGALVVTPQEQGGYNLFDLRLSATLAGFGVAAFVENVGDERGVARAITVNGVVREYVVRPRTYGLTLDYRF